MNEWMDGWSVKASCPLVGPESVGEVPSMGRVFLRDPSPYLREFWSKTPKS